MSAKWRPFWSGHSVWRHIMSTNIMSSEKGKLCDSISCPWLSLYIVWNKPLKYLTYRYNGMKTLYLWHCYESREAATIVCFFTSLNIMTKCLLFATSPFIGNICNGYRNNKNNILFNILSSGKIYFVHIVQLYFSTTQSLRISFFILTFNLSPFSILTNKWHSCETPDNVNGWTTREAWQFKLLNHCVRYSVPNKYK